MTNAAITPDEREGRDDQRVTPPGQDAGMTNAAHIPSTASTRAGDGAGSERPEQLSLLPTSTTHARFHLSRATRERGLRHVAEIRRQLAEARAAHDAENVHRLPPRDPGHHEAA